MTVDLTPPDTIDATGAVDVSDSLSGWLSSLDPGATVTLPDRASYRLDWGLQIGSNGHSRSHPALPARDCPPGLTIRSDGARLFTDRISKTVDGTIDPRLRNGLPLVAVYRADDLTLAGLQLDHARRAGASYDATREDWPCLRIIGGTNVTGTDLLLQGAPGDAVAVNAVVVGGNGGDLYQCEHVAILDSEIRTVGRHGASLQGVYGFTLARTNCHDIERFTVDAELFASRDAVDVVLSGLTGSVGGLGLAQVLAPASAVTDRWTITACDFDLGHLHVTAGTVGTHPLDRQRKSMTITENRSRDPRPRTGRKPLIFVGRFDDVTITGNRDRVGRADRALQLNRCGGTISTDGNDWSPT